MSSNPISQSTYTTTGQVRYARNATGVDITQFSLELRLTEAVAAVKHTFPAAAALPANAQVDHIHIHPLIPITIQTATHVGIGVTGNPDEYMEVTATTIDAVGENVTTAATVVSPSATAKTLFLHATNGSGAGAGDIEGDWNIRITGRIIQPSGA